MNSDACGVFISRTILGSAFFALLLVCQAQANQWDPKGAALAFQEAQQKRDEISQATQPSIRLYLECAKTYRKVHVRDPHYGRTGYAIYEEGLVYQEMGDKFADLEFYKTAVKRFNLLVKDYGGNHNCPDALSRLGDIYLKHLKDESAAQNAYQTLRTRYSHSSVTHKLDTREPALKPPSEPSKTDNPQVANTLKTPSIQSIRYWSAGEYTRVIIDMDFNAKYSKERLSSPERIYFDVSNAKLGRDLQTRAILVNDEFLKQIRIAPKSPDTIRIVLDLAASSNYSVSELLDPFRIVIDLYKHGATNEGLKKPPLESKPRSDADTPKAASKPNSVLQDKTDRRKVEHLTQAESIPAVFPAKAGETKAKQPPLAITQLPPSPAKIAKSAPASLPTDAAKAQPLESKTAKRPADSAIQASVKKDTPSDPIMDAKVTLPTLASAENQSSSRVVRSAPAASSTGTPAKNAENRKPDSDVSPPISISPKAAPPTSLGDRTLTRMLGLKIGRIVIDPGHGGHDLGSIGPGGLFEKDLVLSLAFDLQKLLQEKLGAEVLLTRSDDTFIPLEERTAIANQHRADLFISIHANSSRARSVSGVETYYLDFAKTAADREIAARENATTTSNIHELEDLIKKIAQADKSAESRELALFVQKNLYSGAKELFPSAQNRGVRSAPFIVLIGANMPSVLAEVAFISNPRDERLLKRPSNQERLVKALFSGIEGYMKTLGSELVQNQTRIK